MARAPNNDSSSRTWNEDTATVTFGDDLLEDFPPRAASARISAPPPPSFSGVTGIPSQRPSSLPPPSQRRAPSIPLSVLLPPAPESIRSGTLRAAPPTLPSPGLSAYMAQRDGRSSARPSNRSSFSSRLARWLSPLQRLVGPHDEEQQVATPLPTPSTYSGLDTLRPYVGSRPQILVGKGEGDVAVPRSQKAAREALFRGFFWGVSVASLVFVTLTLSSRLIPGSSQARPATAPVHLDADTILPRRAQEQPLLERAAHGEKEALAQLKKKPSSSLSPDEAAAISRGEEMRARSHATEAVAAIAKKRTFSSVDRAEFLRHAGNQRTFREALLALAQSESEAGPDLIYQVTRLYRHQKDIAEFARSILLTPPVYKYASPALTAIIDAETLSECSDVRQLVDRVREDGDARVVRHMVKFARTTGCGEHGIFDCYPCLRGDRALSDALRAARDRPSPY